MIFRLQVAHVEHNLVSANTAVHVAPAKGKILAHPILRVNAGMPHHCILRARCDLSLATAMSSNASSIA